MNSMTMFLLFLVLLSGCYQGVSTASINSFETCMEAGGTLLKSFPGRCVYRGETYTKIRR